ncbi:TolB-like translocation protein [Kangiella sp. M94]
MKKIQYGILIVVLPLILAFAYYFSPSKPLSIVKDIGQLPVETYIDGINGQNTIVFKENLYFFKETQQTGRELWKVDKFNNVSLTLETMPGRESGRVEALFKSDTTLYLIVQEPNTYTSLIYYLEDPQGEFIKINPGMYINPDNLKEFNGKYFTLTNSGNNSDNTIVEFDGPDTSYHTITGSNWFYTIEDFTYFNNEIYYSFSDDPLRELRKISGGTETTIYSSNHRIPFLFTTVDGVYIVENNYDTTPSSYDLSLLQENQIIPLKSFSSIDFSRSKVVDEKLVLLAATTGSQINQLWQFNGTEQKQLTDYQEEHYLRIEDLAGRNNATYFFEEGFDGKKLKYSDGVNLYDVVTGYDYSNSLGSTSLLELGGNFIISGRKNQEETTSLAVAILENGEATEVLLDQNAYYYQLFMMEGELYALATKNNSVIELYRIDTQLKVATLEMAFEGEHAWYIGVDDLSHRIYLTYSAVGEYGSPLSVIEGASVQKLQVTNATGGSYPKNYTVVKDKTYFIAKHDEYGEIIWESDGYDAQLVETIYNEKLDYYPEMMFSVDGRLIYFQKNVNSSYLQVWALNEGGPQKISQNSYNYLQDSFTNDGTQLYFVGGYDGSSLKYLWRVTPSRVDLIGELEFTSTDMELINTPHGIFFTTGYDGYTGVWQIDGSSLIEFNKNGLEFSAPHHREILWDSGSVYVKECIDEYHVALYKINDGSGLEEIDIGELSGKRCTDIWFHQLDNENVISIIDHGSQSMGVWVLEDGQIVKVDSFGIPSYTQFVAKDSRLYFNARPSDSGQNYLYVYENGEAKNLNLGLVSDLKIAKGKPEDDVDWLFYKEQYTSNGYQLYKYDGTNMSLHNSISNDYLDIYNVTKVGEINFLQIGNSGGDNQLIALDDSGELTYLNSDQSISFSTNGSYGENLMANGHGKWLFMQGCHYTVGCEPYSLNLNQLPSAGFTTDKNHYVAGYEVVVDGSESTDPENNIIKYNWKLIDYEYAQIEGNGNKQASIKLPLVAQDTNLTIELEIVDDGYDKSIATKQISVEFNHPPEVVINAPGSAVEGSVIELSAEGSSDVEGESLSFQWSVVEGDNIVLNNANQMVASFTVPSLEEETDITVAVSVSDTVGNTSTAEAKISLQKSSGNTNPDPESGGGSSGGGSTNWLLLLMLASLMIIRAGYYRR